MVAHLRGIVHLYEMLGRFLIHIRPSIGGSLILELIIVFEILYLCINDGSSSKSRCIGYNFFCTSFTYNNISYIHIVYMCCNIKNSHRRLMFFQRQSLLKIICSIQIE